MLGNDSGSDASSFTPCCSHNPPAADSSIPTYVLSMSSRDRYANVSQIANETKKPHGLARRREARIKLSFESALRPLTRIHSRARANARSDGDASTCDHQQPRPGAG